MRSKLVSRSEFARRAGVSAAAVTKACKGALAPACDGDRIDAAHEAAVEYLSRHAKTNGHSNGAAAATAETTGNGAADSAAAYPDEPVDLDEYGDLTLREIVERFGTSRAFRDWLQSLGDIQRIRREQMAFQASRGELVSREMARAAVFGLIDATNRRLLRDAPKTICRRIYANAKAGTPLEKSEALVREIIGSQLSLAIENAKKALEVSPTT